MCVGVLLQLSFVRVISIPFTWMLAFCSRTWPTKIPLKFQIGWAMLCSRRTLSSIAEMIEEGRLREINVFGSDHVLPSEYEYDAIMEAYSYSRFVHIPVNQKHLHHLDTISSEVLEKMLATSLLCQYRRTSISIARAICERREASTRMYSYGHCMLAFYADEQWTEMQNYTTSDDLFDYMQHDVSDGLTHNHLLVEVVRAVLKSWIHTDNIDETCRFLDLLVTKGIHWESIMIGNRDILPETLSFLRYHGQHDLSHRLLSLIQHNLQRQIFDSRTVMSHCKNKSKSKRKSKSQVNTALNDLIAFSACLFDKEDMKYVSSVYEYYVKYILPSRSSYNIRLFDIENIMTSVLSPYRVVERDRFNENSVLLFAEKEKYFQNKAKRALVGYDFFKRLRHKQHNLRSHLKDQGVHIYSPKICTQVISGINS